METVVKTDVTAGNEPLLQELTEGGEKYIYRHLKYKESEGNDDENALIAELSTTARELSEKELNKSLAEKTLQTFWTYDEAKRLKYKFELPFGPISTVTSVKVLYGDNSDPTTLTAYSDYYIHGNQYKTIKSASVSGTVSSSVVSGYLIEYVAGYGAANCETIPEALKALLARQAAQWFSERAEENALVLSHEIRKGLMQFSRKSWL